MLAVHCAWPWDLCCRAVPTAVMALVVSRDNMLIDGRYSHQLLLWCVMLDVTVLCRML
jgi:hypothetical protein